MIIDGVDIRRKYTIQEIMDMYKKGKLRPIGVAGYIVRADADGMVGFVPQYESTLFRMETGTMLKHSSDTFSEDMRKEVEHEHPMVRRAGWEKRAALVRRLLKAAQIYGTVPGFTDEQMSSMIGEKWVTGVSVITENMLDRVSIYFLGEGEKANREHNDHQVTRDHPLA